MQLMKFLQMIVDCHSTQVMSSYYELGLRSLKCRPSGGVAGIPTFSREFYERVGPLREMADPVFTNRPFSCFGKVW